MKTTIIACLLSIMSLALQAQEAPSTPTPAPTATTPPVVTPAPVAAPMEQKIMCLKSHPLRCFLQKTNSFKLGAEVMLDASGNPQKDAAGMFVVKGH